MKRRSAELLCNRQNSGTSDSDIAAWFRVPLRSLCSFLRIYRSDD